MGEETKKISFGFSKLSKKTFIISSKNTQNPKPEGSGDIEFIEGFESNSIKLKDPIKTVENVLVIPLKRPSSVESAADNLPTQDVTRLEDEAIKTPKPSDELQSSVVMYHNDKNLGGEIPQQEILTLDELAAKEILDDLNKERMAKSESKVISVPLSSTTSTGEKESTIDDYENVPVGEFGIAMLRGMGWTPGKGIGKNEKLVESSVPLVRPKGMGLGADKVIQMPSNDKSKTDDDLKMSIGSFIRVIAGPNKDFYGKIEGFDDESGRAFVKLAVKNQTISLNEFMFQLVNKSDFLKNSKVVNVGKYEQYIKSEEKNEDFKTGNITSKGPKESTDFESSHCSRSLSSCRINHSRHSPTRDKKTKDNESLTKYHRDSSSISDQSSTSSSGSYSRTKQRRKKKKPSSHRLKSRSRSRSPRKSKKHKKKSR